jgi:hypothetical protein
MYVIDSDKHCHGKIKCLQDAGIRVIFRYYAREYQPNFPQKILEYDEALALSKAKFLLGVCYQYNARSNDVFSKNMGLKDGKFAREYAGGKIKQPAKSAIYFGVDYDPGDGALKTNIVPHFEGIVAAMKENTGYPQYEIGVYGPWYVCEQLSKLGLVKYTWLANPPGWGDRDGRKKFVNSNKWTLMQRIRQDDICGVDHDPNEVQTGVTEFGQFALPLQQA